jgi:argininosuccinate synthase
MKLFRGNCVVVGRKSPASLYQLKLATYDKGDIFDQSDSASFIRIWGLPLKIQSQAQGLAESRKAKRTKK